MSSLPARAVSTALFLSLLAFGARAEAAPVAAPVPATSPSAAAASGAYAAFVSDAKRQTGLFDVLEKGDQVYFDLDEAALGKTYAIEPVISKGIGGGAFAGRTFDSVAIRFVRQGNRILWTVPNQNFLASSQSEHLALEESTSDSIVGSSPIVAENTATKRIVISPVPLLSDFAGVLGVLNRASQSVTITLLSGPTANYGFDPSNTYVSRIKAFPSNVEMLVNLGFTAPPKAPPTIADGRGFDIAMHYSIIELPADTTYAPRAADDRVGYFVDTFKKIDDGSSASPFVRYIDRWNLKNGPIVFYLTNEIPHEYRAPIREAILTWNDAFARIGLPRAIEVRDQPVDPAWDPDDARYSSVRWIASDTPSFGAYAGNFTNPLTGEIFRSEIVIDGEYLRSVKHQYVNENTPMDSASESAGCVGTECSFVRDFANQAAFAGVASTIMGRPVDRTRFTEQWLQSVVLHETGHALGLRHNFAGSTLYSLANLHDKAFTERRGLASSVMDYLPANISPPHQPQGSFFQLHLGPYDYWAIKYGYQPNVDLQAVARESSRREYAFGTDEDALSYASLDPRITAFDLSSDPLAYAKEQFDLSRSVIASLDRRFPGGDGSYYGERLAFVSVLENYLHSAMISVKYIGGEYTSRTHRGQPEGRAPFAPVPRATARRAFDLLAENIFAPDAFTFSPSLLRDLGPDYFHGWGDVLVGRPDFPLVAVSASAQDAVLGELFAPLNLGRINDMEAAYPNSKSVLRLQDVFEWSRTAAFADVESPPSRPVSAAHRELQRHFVDLMVSYYFAPSSLVGASGAPREAQALARYELEQIDRGVTQALARRSMDVTTRAHLEELKARTGRALAGVNILSP
jgi:hypothetical protein